MPTHIWGDPQFDWQALGDAMHEIKEYARNKLHLTIWLKEKYGTIRYEFIELWEYDSGIPFPSPLNPIKAVEKFRKIVFKVADKYPHIKEEILEDLYDTFD